MQISLYSHRAEVHDAITKLPGSFERTVEGARLLRECGVPVSFANVLMRGNEYDYKGVQELAARMGIEFKIDATITPMMDGGRDVLALNIEPARLAEVYRDTSLTGGVDTTCELPAGPMDAKDALESIPCSAGHTLAYVSPYGDVYPCVQFPYPCGNVRQQPFAEIWRNSTQLAEVRAISLADVEGCSTCVHGSSCSRCPGLAYTEGNMRGPSIQDCERSYALTGIASENLKQKKRVIWLAAI